VASVTVTVAVVMRITGMIVTMFVGMRTHPHHSTHSLDAAQHSPLVIGQFDTPPMGMD
jgi:hypothetical protein